MKGNFHIKIFSFVCFCFCTFVVPTLELNIQVSYTLLQLFLKFPGNSYQEKLEVVYIVVILDFVLLYSDTYTH